MKRRGLSLLEVLVVLAVLVVLLAIAVGVLSSARDHSRRATTLSNLRTHAHSIAAYSGEYSDCFPYFTLPGFASTTLTSGSMSITVSFFDAHHTWHLALADSYYGGNPFSKVFVSPRYFEHEGGTWPLYTPYHYACAFIADPRYWSPTTRRGPDQFTSTQFSQVLYPSAKSLVIESWPFMHDISESGGRSRSASRGLPVVFTDGAARIISGSGWLNGYEKGDGYEFVSDGAIHYNDMPPLLHTIDGIRGRDVP